MKDNSRIYLKGLLILFVLLILILLFPPYTTDKSRLYSNSLGFRENTESNKWAYTMKDDYKFFDFVFNSETIIKKLDETYSYKIYSLEREITGEDSIGAIKISTTNIIDTLRGFTRQMYLTHYFEYDAVAKTYDDIAKKWREQNPDRKLDTVLNYTITELTKFKYFIGYRKLLVSQLITEILLSISITGLVTVFLLLIEKKNYKIKKQK